MTLGISSIKLQARSMLLLEENLLARSRTIHGTHLNNVSDLTTLYIEPRDQPCNSNSLRNDSHNNSRCASNDQNEHRGGDDDRNDRHGGSHFDCRGSGGETLLIFSHTSSKILLIHGIHGVYLHLSLLLLCLGSNLPIRGGLQQHNNSVP